MRKFRVLTLDGGGIRGLYTASLLNSLANHFSDIRGISSLDIGKGFNLIAGTSTGGILACALASGVPLSKVIELYRKKGSQIFPSPVPTGKKFYLWAARHLNKPSGSANSLRQELKTVFGAVTLGELWNTRRIALCIPSVYASTMGSKVFKTPHSPILTIDKHYPLVDVCLATSAAPIIFPLATITPPQDQDRTEHYADGGLWANNPVLVALLEALEIVSTTDSFDEIEVYSIGTCAPTAGNRIENPAKGIKEWKAGVEPLNMAMEAQAIGSGFMANLVAKHAKTKCSVMRLPCDPPSPDDAKLLGLDNPAKEALDVLSTRAHHDSLKVQSMLKSDTSPLNGLKDAFLKMPAMENNHD